MYLLNKKKKPFEFYVPQQNLVKKKKQNNKENWNIIWDKVPKLSLLDCR